MGVDEGNPQVIDVDVILENCPITISLRCILTSSDYGVYNSHYMAAGEEMSWLAVVV